MRLQSSVNHESHVVVWSYEREDKMNDMLAEAMRQSVRRFGESEGRCVFNAANLSNVIMRFANLSGVIDGRVIEVLLTGRDDVEFLGASYYRYKGA